MKETTNSSTKRVPKLRFPEFRNAPEWKESTIGEIGSFYYGKSAPKWSLADDAPTPCVRYGELYTKFGSVIKETYSRTTIEPTKLRFSKGGEILVPRVGEKPEDFGKCCCYLPLKHIAIGEMISVFETKQNPLFYTYYFRSLHKDFAKVVEGQNVKNLYYVELEPLTIYRPSKLEQQRIADCLSSLDEWIAAEGKRLGALKEHKKGLMQQLFPAEGETTPKLRVSAPPREPKAEQEELTRSRGDAEKSMKDATINSPKRVPKLRFPEFQDAPEWEEKRLGELITVTSCRRVHQSDWTSEGVPFYRARELVALINKEPIKPLFISEELYMSNVKVNGGIAPGELLVTGVGSIGVPYLIKEGDRFYFKDGNIIWLKNDESSLTGAFLYLLYGSQYVQQQITRMAGVGTVGTYTIDNAKNTSVSFPTDKVEQQRIADCLSSLDELITAQASKIEALKEHKKGLMQQLFPSASPRLRVSQKQSKRNAHQEEAST